MKDTVAVVVTDSNVDRLYGDAFVRSLESKHHRVERIVFSAGERSKNLETYGELVRGFAALGLTRHDVAYALGGGVVGDLTGFAAATYMRGIDFVQVPTTLLAMVDSSIGGKTGVDIPEGKNLVGAFHLPKQIIRDTGYLKTLPEREMKNGFAEMIKTAILFDPKMFAALSPRPSLDALAPLVERCARWKEKIVSEDFREGGKRKLLNLGHTFGHAIESASDFRLSHGEAVAAGMRIVGRDVPEIAAILDEYGFPQVGEIFKDLGLAPEDLRGYLANDKKRIGDGVTLVVPKCIGECELRNVPLNDLGAFLR